MPLSALNTLREDPSALNAKRVLVIGDIALDHTYLCNHPEPGAHATHAGETILDVRDDDFGTVGSSYNTCLLSGSLGAHALLVTAIGRDPEGARVKAILRKHRMPARYLEVAGMQTVTKIRAFLRSTSENRYNLHIRLDKDPLKTAYSKTADAFGQTEFIDWLQTEMRLTDALLLNDTEKGFLSAGVIRELAQIADQVDRERNHDGRRPLITLVDPKQNWEKFFGFPSTVFKPNRQEAERAVDLLGDTRSLIDNDLKGYLRTLCKELHSRYSAYFPNIVVTLGEHGAALVAATSDGAIVHHFPSFPSNSTSFNVSTHCGDMFGSALLLALILQDDLELQSAIEFGNYIGSLQFSKRTGMKVSRDDILSEPNVLHLHQNYRPFVRVCTIDDPREKVARKVLGAVGRTIDYRDAYYRQSSLIAAPPFASCLDSGLSSDVVRRDGIVFIYGDSGSGKGAIIYNLGAFVDGYLKQEDEHNAHAVLDTPGELRKAIEKADKRKTCLVLDEIQSASDPGIAQLLTEFPKQDSGKSFCLICAGHYDSSREALCDLYFRSSTFEVPPYDDPVRRFDLPYLIAYILRDERGANWKGKYISALALRELLRCSYGGGNSRALQRVVRASCRAATGDTLDWEHIDLSVIDGGKPAHRPFIPELQYLIAIA